MREDAKGPIRFWKMTGAGNDFIALPTTPDRLPEDPAIFVQRVCRRGLSVGADGVLFVTPPRGAISSTAHGASWTAADQTVRARPPDRGRASDEGPDAVLIHYNADGGRSAFCGNGTRCAARFATLMGFADPPLVLLTDAGRVRAEVSGEAVRIDVPPPSSPVGLRLTARGSDLNAWLVLAGVPHLIVPVSEPEAVNVAALGAALRAHPRLGPEGANVDFIGPYVGGRAPLRTFERGVEAETLACGSGAIATAAVLARSGAASPITLSPRSGI